MKIEVMKYIEKVWAPVYIEELEGDNINDWYWEKGTTAILSNINVMKYKNVINIQWEMKTMEDYANVIAIVTYIPKVKFHTKY